MTSKRFLNNSDKGSQFCYENLVGQNLKDKDCTFSYQIIPGGNAETFAIFEKNVD